jgi:hypothetical protein
MATPIEALASDRSYRPAGAINGELHRRLARHTIERSRSPQAPINHLVRGRQGTGRGHVRCMEEFVMTFLDVRPIMLGLRTRPAEFEMDRGWLHHFPSRASVPCRSRWECCAKIVTQQHESEDNMLKCALCGRSLKETAAWKASNERYYCNEFWAEGGKIDSPPLAPNVTEEERLVATCLNSGVGRMVRS